MLFLICAADYDHLTAGGIKWFQFLYCAWRGGRVGEGLLSVCLQVFAQAGWCPAVQLDGGSRSRSACHTHASSTPWRLSPPPADFSSFWGQFGPNATTWLLPAEIVPTEMRVSCACVPA